MRGLVPATLWALLATPGATAQTNVPPDGARSIQSGVYTLEQARRGEQVYREVCSACHLPDWFSQSFLQSWSGNTAAALFELIRTTMPEDRPGALKRQQYVDMLAYIFELNGVPPGEDEMPGRKRALEALLIEMASAR
jgi:mono/diheme cytochrome c family protein